MNSLQPGFSPARMVKLIQEAIKRCHLDLSGAVVLTEAATGAYAVTPVIAAMAGAARVFAVAKSTRYGLSSEVIRQTNILAKQGDVGKHIQITGRVTKTIVSAADIITNSGHLRPLDSKKVRWMKPSAVIPLMYEAWEFREKDIDLNACRKKGIQVAGTNEQHPNIDVFGYLGELAMKQLMDAGISIYKSKILLLSDNDFCPYISRSLRRGGASVDIGIDINGRAASKDFDVILLAMRPEKKVNLSSEDICQISLRWPSAVIVQFFGDMDRRACREMGVLVWPKKEPAHGHMGILPSAVGPESTIRLQVGGFKAAEVVCRHKWTDGQKGTEYIQMLDGFR